MGRVFEVVGETDHGRPIFLLIIGRQDSHLHERPGFWLDGGTHAVEWTSVMSTLFTVSDWLEKLANGDTAETQYFETHTAYVMPCIAPDGYNAMIEGSPFIRSTLRPPRNGAQQIGLVPKDMTGDGAIRWMRWRHPAGPMLWMMTIPTSCALEPSMMTHRMPMYSAKRVHSSTGTETPGSKHGASSGSTSIGISPLIGHRFRCLEWTVANIP